MEDIGTAARLSCYALISALETDLRRWLSDAFVAAGLDEFLHPDHRKAALDRRGRDPAATPESQASDYSLIEYLDFGDLGKLIFQHIAVLPSNSTATAKEIAHTLEGLISLRNRVCHSRPLELDDFSTIADAARKFVRSDAIAWKALREALHMLEQRPAAILSSNVPEYWAKPSSVVQNNLPIPEFEDTGFIGRANDIDQISKSLLGPYPVISIIGEGGLGKTALAIKVLYDLIDDPLAQERFDVICWVSLKLSRLTAAGIVEMRGALTTTLELFQHAAQNLGAPEPDTRSMKGALREVIEYMREFRVLLTIDNVETVGHPELVEFLKELPNQSKVLMTSRIGMGQIEFPYALHPLEAKDAAHLFRRTARAQNMTALVQAKQERVEKWCKRLHFNPLAIKWFVSAVALGKEPNELVNPAGEDYKQLLKFSFENLYSRLSEEAKQLVQVLSVVGTPATRTEISLIFATVSPSISQDSIDAALIILYNASVIRRQIPRDAANASSGPRYGLTDFAAQFVRQFATVPRTFATRVQGALRKVRDISENSVREIRYYKYQPRAVRAKTKEERLMRGIIMQALEEFEEGKVAAGFARLDGAERLMSGFAELHRFRAYMFSKTGDLLAARQEFERALECDASSEIVRYQFAFFLMQEIEDYDAAFQVAEPIVRDAPDDFPPRSLMAMIETRRGNYQVATDSYEALLTAFGGDLLTKHRISLRDQAAEAYRRWSEQHLSYREPAQFRRCIGRALEIILDGLQAGESDRRLERTLGEVCGEAVLGYSLMRDEAGASDFVRLLHKYRDHLPRVIEIHSSVDKFISVFSHIPGFEESVRVLPLSGEAGDRSSELQDDSRLRGRVHNIAAVGNYGFIETPDGEHWFFHRLHMRNQDQWRNAAPGRMCTFSVGTNARGRCAVDVELESGGR